MRLEVIKLNSFLFDSERHDQIESDDILLPSN